MTQSSAAQSPVDLDTKRAARGSRGRTPARPAPLGPMIKQRDISELRELREDVKQLETRIAEARKLVTEAELPILLALSTHGYVESGPLAVAVKVDTRRTPHWRDEYEKLAGKDAADIVIQRTAPTETRKLVISGLG